MSGTLDADAIVRRILAAAVNEWSRGVHEAPGPGWERIRTYLKVINHSAWDTYHADGDAQWCGAFAGFVLAQAGMNVELLTQKEPPERGGIGSSYRLKYLALLDGGARLVPPAEVRAGDIVSVGRTDKGRPSWGEHEVIVARRGKTTIDTYEGNATGVLSDGTWTQGVITRTRNITPTESAKGILVVMRPLLSDFS